MTEQCGFEEPAKDKDFTNENERIIYRSLPAMMRQKRVNAFKKSIYVPDYANVLVFDSRFESGNLRKVAKVHNSEYNLWLNSDTNTRGHTQWFYFKVQYKDMPNHKETKTH
jgi:hypothetical protein